MELVTVAGFSEIGIVVKASQEHASTLARLAKQGNYWSNLVVRHIKELTSGHMHSDFAYVKRGKEASGQFILNLPGCRIDVLKRHGKAYEILNLEANLDFYKLQQAEKQSGLFFAKKVDEGGRWRGQLIQTPKINTHAKAQGVATPVGVSDAYDNLNEAAEFTADHIAAVGKDLQGDSAAQKGGFNFFYTEGKRRLGGVGWRSIKEAMGADTHESFNQAAVLLADAMKNSREESLIWVSQRGGSGVLTQAMAILVKMEVTLPKHKVILSQATTSQREAYKHIRALGMQLEANDKIGTYNAYSLDEMVGGLGLGIGYARLLKDRFAGEAGYTRHHLVRDGKELKSALTKTAGAYTAIGAVAVGGAMLAVPAKAAAIAAISGAKLLTTQTLMTGAGAAIAGKLLQKGYDGAKNLAFANVPGMKDYANYQKVLDQRKGI